jgi:hypothetical protein
VTDDLHQAPPVTDEPQQSPPPAAPDPAGRAAAATLPPNDPAAPRKPPMPDYKGDELDAERGPGLGCFWLQVILLAFFIVFTPLTVELGWPPIVSAILLFVTLGLLLFVGQTVIFLLRIVAAERRGRRRPVASRTRTVGEIEEAAAAAEPGGGAAVASADAAGTPTAGAGDEPGTTTAPVGADGAPAPPADPAAAPAADPVTTDGPTPGGGVRQ